MNLKKKNGWHDGLLEFFPVSWSDITLYPPRKRRIAERVRLIVN